MCWFIFQAALSKTILTRVTSPAGSERELAALSSRACCQGLNTNAAFGRPIAIGTSIVHKRHLFSVQDYCNLLMGQYIRSGFKNTSA
jgi:hypothetical protein